jgi:hypothetical protein
MATEMGSNGQRFKGSFLSDTKPVDTMRGAAADFSKLPPDVQVQIIELSKGVELAHAAPAALTFVRRYPGWQPA